MDDGQQTHGPSRRPAPGVLARLAGVKRTRSDVWQHRSAPSATRGQRFSRGEHSVTSRLSLQLETEPLLPHQPETGPCVALRPEQSRAGPRAVVATPTRQQPRHASRFQSGALGVSGKRHFQRFIRSFDPTASELIVSTQDHSTISFLKLIHTL